MPAERPVVAVGAIVQQYGRLLLVQRANEPQEGSWCLPGGRVEPGELLAEAVVRELEEETGLAGLCGPCIGWGEGIGADYHHVIFNFEVTVLETREPEPGVGEHAAVWVPLPDVIDLPLMDGLAEFLADHDIISTIL